MECPAANALLDDYAKTTLECYEVAETILAFVGSDDQFEQARLRARQIYAKRESARLALEAHLEHHNCGLSKQSIRKTKTRTKQKSVGQTLAEGKAKDKTERIGCR